MSQSSSGRINLEGLNPADFWCKVHRHPSRPNTCWVWLGGMDHKGYGRFYVDGRTHGAHRVAYTLAIGQIGPGLELDHLCRRPDCVNPTHLDPVTQRINQLRGHTLSAKNIAKTHCPRGHPLSGDNLYIHPSGSRVCKRCSSDASNAYQKRKRRERGPIPPKTHCKRGHPLSGDNIYTTPSTGRRMCRTCHDAAMKRWNERKRHEQS